MVQSFGSLREMLHFCITTEGEPKMDHGHETSVGYRIDELQCIFKTHFGLWVPVGDNLRNQNQSQFQASQRTPTQAPVRLPPTQVTQQGNPYPSFGYTQ
jgi:hypothetical protein